MRSSVMINRGHWIYPRPGSLTTMSICIGSQAENPIHCTTSVMVVEAWDVPLVPVILTV